MKRKPESNACKPYAMFSSVDLKDQKVLAGFLLHGKVIPKM